MTTEFTNVCVRVLTSALVVATYYWLVKKWLFKFARYIAPSTALTRKFPLTQVVLVFELVLAAMSHAAFAVFLFWYVMPRIGGLPTGLLRVEPIALIAGAVLGVGTMSASFLVSRCAMKALQFAKIKNVPTNDKAWIAVARAGWLQHHFATLKVLPGWLSFAIIGIQVGSEELVFRGVLLNFLNPLGGIAAATVSSALFILMQAIYMPNLVSSMFPMIGATVMSLAFCPIALTTHMLLPLIAAHIAFFYVSVL